jgi:hypothetical protein
MAARGSLCLGRQPLFEQWLGAIQWAPGKEIPVELRLNASSDCAARERAIVSERKRGLRASGTRPVARTCAINARHKRASGILRRTRRLVTCHALSWRGAYLPTHVRDG